MPMIDTNAESGSAESRNVQRLARLDCCAVSDAMDKLHLSGVVSGLPQLSGSSRIAGLAVTVKLLAGNAPPGPARHLCTAAIELAGPGHVIVVEQRSGIEAGSWGGILTLGAKLRGIEGVVADGPVRDIDEARSHGFPVFARGCTARKLTTALKGDLADADFGLRISFGFRFSNLAVRPSAGGRGRCGSCWCPCPG